jgi:hypothetical protein
VFFAAGPQWDVLRDGSRFSDRLARMGLGM